MAMTYERDDARRRITVTMKGEATFAEFLDLLERQATERTWRYGLLHLDDDLVALDTADVRRLTHEVERLNRDYGRRGPVAVVCNRADTYGTARMYSTLSERQQVVAVFQTRAEAETWLDYQPVQGDDPRR